MTLILLTPDGTAYVGPTYEALVTAMREDGLLTAGKDNAEYRQSVAYRIFRLDDVVVRYDNDANFLTDLVAHDYIQLETLQ